MKKISIEELKELSRSLLFEMKEAEYLTLQEEFNIILSQMELLGEIKDFESVEPMAFPFKIEETYLREDEVKDLLTVEEALQNAHSVVNNQVKISGRVK